MTFKPDASTRTVTGSFYKPDGKPSEGILKIQLVNPVLGREENVAYTQQIVEIPLEEDGSFSIDLPVTEPGLTIAEKEEVNAIQLSREANLNQLAAVQESINDYLEKLSKNLAVTEQETEAYNANIELKKDLQSVAINLTKQYNAMLDKQKELQKYIVKVRMELQTKNPVSKTRLDFTIPDGSGPIDMTDLPRV